MTWLGTHDRAFDSRARARANSRSKRPIESPSPRPRCPLARHASHPMQQLRSPALSLPASPPRRPLRSMSVRSTSVGSQPTPSTVSQPPPLNRLAKGIAGFYDQCVPPAHPPLSRRSRPRCHLRRELTTPSRQVYAHLARDVGRAPPPRALPRGQAEERPRAGAGASRRAAPPHLLSSSRPHATLRWTWWTPS